MLKLKGKKIFTILCSKKIVYLNLWIISVYFPLCVNSPFLKRLSLQLRTFFEKKKILLKMVFVKVELSYVFTINLFTIAENCMEK